LQDAIEHSSLGEDEAMLPDLHAAFPRAMQERFAEAIDAHRLRGEIVATKLANRIVNRIGILHPFELAEEEGATFADIAAMFVVAERQFDLAWYPGIGSDEANRYNRIAKPTLYDAAVVLLGPARSTFVAGYKFDIRPATDDRPFFFRFFTWSLLPQLTTMQGQAGFVFVDAGYLVLILALFQAVVASCGTALTPQQAQQLRRFTGKMVLSFDPDAAGQGAAAKSCEMLVAEGFEVNVAVLPAGLLVSPCSTAGSPTSRSTRRSIPRR